MLLVTTKSPTDEPRGAVIRVQNLIRRFKRRLIGVYVICGVQRADESFLGVPVKYLPFKISDIPLIVKEAFTVSFSTALFKRRALTAEMLMEGEVLFHLVRPYQPVEGASVIIDLCESLSENLRVRALALSRYSVKRFIYKFESKRLSRLEKTIIRDKSIRKIVITADAFPSMAPEEAKVLPNSSEVTDDLWRKNFSDNRLGFLGHVDYELNYQSILLISSWAAKISDELIVDVVGRCSSDARVALSSHRNIRVHGFLENAHAVLSHCAAGICLMPTATGQQNKVVDYVILGIPPIVSENVRAAFPGEAPFWVAEDPETFFKLLSSARKEKDRQKYLTQCSQYLNWVEDSVGSEFR